MELNRFTKYMWSIQANGAVRWQHKDINSPDSYSIKAVPHPFCTHELCILKPREPFDPFCMPKWLFCISNEVHIYFSRYNTLHGQMQNWQAGLTSWPLSDFREFQTGWLEPMKGKLCHCLLAVERGREKLGPNPKLHLVRKNTSHEVRETQLSKSKERVFRFFPWSVRHQHWSHAYVCREGRVNTSQNI